ncbi:hypothetical protein WR25_15337 isoform B [Diploscapter pachys]|uniref:C3H1-type domain-containing protein n=1 Tax=Diploscapter pachys TaxID=2018661 RepID=A0A2A2KL77_9BILA|nr:hypothetical protein WR25_15337 isoform B [Diploscapter pachys]
MAHLSEFSGRMDEAEEGEIFSSPATPETFDPSRQIEAEPVQHYNRPTQHDESYIDRLIVEAGQAEERKKAGGSQEMFIDEDPDVLRRLALDSMKQKKPKKPPSRPGSRESGEISGDSDRNKKRERGSQSKEREREKAREAEKAERDKEAKTGKADGLIPQTSQIKERVSFGRGGDARRKEVPSHISSRKISSYGSKSSFRYRAPNRPVHPPFPSHGVAPARPMPPIPRTIDARVGVPGKFSRPRNYLDPNPKAVQETSKTRRLPSVDDVFGSRPDQGVMTTLTSGLPVSMPGVISPITSPRLLQAIPTPLTMQRVIYMAPPCTDDNYDEIPMDTSSTPSASVAPEDCQDEDELTTVSEFVGSPQSLNEQPSPTSQIQPESGNTTAIPAPPQPSQSIEQLENAAKRLQQIEQTLKKKLAEATKAQEEKRELLSFVVMKDEQILKLKTECSKLVMESETIKIELYALRGKQNKASNEVLEKAVQEDDAWIRETKSRAESLTKEIQETRVKKPDPKPVVQARVNLVQVIRVERPQNSNSLPSNSKNMGFLNKLTLPPPPAPPVLETSTLPKDPPLFVFRGSSKPTNSQETIILDSTTSSPQSPDPEPEEEEFEEIGDDVQAKPEPVQERRRSSSSTLDEATLRAKLLERIQPALQNTSTQEPVSSESSPDSSNYSDDSRIVLSDSEPEPDQEAQANFQILSERKPTPQMAQLQDTITSLLADADRIKSERQERHQKSPQWEWAKPSENAPNDVACPFDLLGACRNNNCPYIHLKRDVNNPWVSIARNGGRTIETGPDPNADVYSPAKKYAGILEKTTQTRANSNLSRTYSRFNWVMHNE